MVQNTRSRRNRKRRMRLVTLVDVIIVLVVSVVALSMLYPFLNLLFISVSPTYVMTKAKGLLLYPQEITLESYRYVFSYNNVWPSYQNTVFITVVGTSLSLLLSGMGGYALSKKELPGRTLMTLFVVITMWFSGGLIPTYINLRRLDLTNTLWVLILPECVSAWNLMLMRNFFIGIPGELKDSAYIDGAGEVRTMLQIVLPLSMPVVATMALFYGVGYWNEYTAAILYNSKKEYYTLQVIIQRMYTVSIETVVSDEFLDRIPPTDSIRSATVVFATLPILCVYPFLQKYFAKGVMVGSLKG